MLKIAKKRQPRVPQLSAEAYAYFSGALSWEEVKNPFSILALETGMDNEFREFVLLAVDAGVIALSDSPEFSHTLFDPIRKLYKTGVEGEL
jgi:hypothetical protein